MSLRGCRIVHVTSVHRPRDVRIFEKMCRSLVDQGADVTLIAVADQSQTIEGVRCIAVPRPKNRWQRMTSTTRQAMRAARELRPAIIHVHDPELIPWAVWSRWRGEVTIYDMHENVPFDMMSKPWVAPWIRWPLAQFVRGIERCLLPNQPVVFAAPSFPEYYPWIRRAISVLNMPRLESLPIPTDNRRPMPTVAYIGSVSRDRGSMVTLAALDQLQQAGLHVAWECIGPIAPQAHADEMYAFVKTHALTDVSIRGYIPSSEGWERIRDCHIGLCVLLPEPNFIPTYPTKLFEYMALGMPVIASNFPRYREIIEGNACGICVDPLQPAELAAAIRRLVEDPELARSMGQKGREAVVQRYQWSAEFAKLCTFYEQLLSDGRRASAVNGN